MNGVINHTLLNTCILFKVRRQHTLTFHLLYSFLRSETKFKKLLFNNQIYYFTKVLFDLCWDCVCFGQYVIYKYLFIYYIEVLFVTYKDFIRNWLIYVHIFVEKTIRCKIHWICESILYSQLMLTSKILII